MTIKDQPYENVFYKRSKPKITCSEHVKKVSKGKNDRSGESLNDLRPSCTTILIPQITDKEKVRV